MDLIAQARKDLDRIHKAEFSVDLTLEDTQGNTATVKGTAAKHHMSVDVEGRPVNAKNVHATLSERNILAANGSYKTRDANGDVRMLNHLVTYTDASGNARKYKVTENFPDDTLGVIVLVLSPYKS